MPSQTFLYLIRGGAEQEKYTLYSATRGKAVIIACYTIKYLVIDSSSDCTDTYDYISPVFLIIHCV